MEKHWDSVIKLTPYQTPHKARLANTIQFQSILQLSGLQQALMSSMVVDWPWLLAQLPASVPLTIVKDWDRSHEKPGHHSLPSRRQVVSCLGCTLDRATFPVSYIVSLSLFLSIFG